jgi:hypothetical protein
MLTQNFELGTLLTLITKIIIRLVGYVFFVEEF